MINLNNIEHFAQGGNRRCFVHPLKKDRCLKVSLKDNQKKQKKMQHGIKNLDQQKALMIISESSLLINKDLLRIDNPNKWKHLASGMGWLRHLLGPASETELVLDNNQNIAITLEKYLFTFGMTDEIKKALDDLNLG